MKKGNMKINTMILAVCMIATAFVVVSLPVGADDVSDNNFFDIVWQDSWMEDHPTLPDAQKEIIYNFDATNSRRYHLGDENAEIYLWINSRETDPIDDVWIELDKGTGGTDIIADIPINRWPDTGDRDGFTNGDPIDLIPDGTRDAYPNSPLFEIDIANTGDVNTVYENALLITIHYWDTGGAGSLEEDTFSFDLYVSSIFDDPADTDEDDHHDLPTLEEQVGDIQFEAGETFQHGMLTLTNHHPMIAPVGTISDVWINGSLPSGLSFFQGNNLARIPTATDPGGNFEVNYRINVNSGVLPGMYYGSLSIHYTRNGKRIIENPRSLEVIVDFTPVLQASATVPDINQGDTNVTISITFRNTGNVPLGQLFVRVSMISVSEPGDNEYLFTPLDHYEGTTVKVTDWFGVNVGTDESLILNEVSAPVTINKGLDAYIPAGTHKVLFDWYAFYFDTGVIGGGTDYQHVVQLWEPEDGTGVENVPAMYKDNTAPGDDLYPVDTDLTAAPDELDGSPWQMGTYATVEVVDPKLSVWASIGVIDASGDVTYVELTVNLNNDENVDLINLMVTLEVGPNSPFLDPANHAATTLAMDPSSPDGITAGSDVDIIFYVDINSAWFTSGALAPGVFEVDLTIEATNFDTLEVYAPTTIQMDAPINGFGPELFATMVNYDEIKPGETFTLSISIENFGDDVAREVDAYLRADFVSGWSIVDQFTTSIGGYGGEGGGPVGDASWGWRTGWSGYTQFNRSHDVRPGEIGVDNVPQIVELHDWIRRRETPPQGIILWLHLDRLGPGENYTFVFEMVSDKNMVEGMVYYEVLELYYVDSINGETYGPQGPPFQNHYTPPQEVLIRAGKGEKYQTEEEFDYTYVLYALIFLIIAFIIFLIGYALGGRGGRERIEEPYEPYTEDYGMPEEGGEDLGLPPEEDLGPPPEPEEDLGPSLEEEKK
ncbi:MAG: hypothetical protein JSW00_01335 [Thermoplasmata archaeon]|nr:MAG: hypothetical protein JSW00_01335 [Thermoplasmata archaeon]